MLGHWAALLLSPDPSNAAPSSTDAAQLGHAVWALQFSPRVACVEDAVLVEVASSQRLFGGLDALHADMEAGALELGRERIAWAPTGSGAIALARGGVRDGFARPLAQLLDRLPLESLTAVERHRATLARLGCRCLGDVRKLPRGGMARRFDADLLRALDRAYGLQPEAYEWVTLPEVFRMRLELHARVDTAQALVFGARRLLVLMAGWLAARHFGVTAFTLKWYHDIMRPKTAGASGEVIIRTAAPTQNVDHLARLLSENLAKIRLLAPAGDLELIAAEVTPITEQSASLLPDTIRKGEAVAQVLERVAARLGSARVVRPILVEDHRLEWMQSWQAADAPRPRKGKRQIVLPQPTWVLEQPLELAVVDHRPIYQGPLRLLLGPDRTEGGWWHRIELDSQQQALNVQRDYWVAASDLAGILWVFQQRLQGETTGWFLHGHFA
jgi:protein ImuB